MKFEWVKLLTQGFWALLIMLGGFTSWGMTHVVMKEDLLVLEERVKKTEDFETRIYEQLTQVKADVSYIRGKLE